MANEVGQRREAVKAGLPKGALDVLEAHGIGDANIDAVIGHQLEEEAETKAKTAVPGISNVMTSELVYLSETPEDKWAQEYQRRLGLLGFSGAQIQEFYRTEKTLASTGLDKERNQAWATRYFILPGTTIMNLPEPKQLTLSELVMISDDANAAIARDCNGIMSEEMRAAAHHATSEYSDTRLYHKELVDRTTALGWTEAQQIAFMWNELELIWIYKWNSSKGPAWTEKTTNFKSHSS